MAFNRCKQGCCRPKMPLNKRPNAKIVHKRYRAKGGGCKTEPMAEKFLREIKHRVCRLFDLTPFTLSLTWVYPFFFQKVW
jgi:hypothetical protein